MPRKGILELDRIFLGFEAGAKSLVESGNLRCLGLRRRLGLRSGCLRSFCLFGARTSAAGNNTDRSANGCPLTGVVIRDFADDRARRCPFHCGFCTGTLSGLLSLLLLLGRLLSGLFGLLGGGKGITAGLLHAPVVAFGFVFGLL